jgi:hypothetical protein
MNWLRAPIERSLAHAKGAEALCITRLPAQVNELEKLAETDFQDGEPHPPIVKG